VATAEFRKAADILGGLWEKVRERPDEFLERRIIEAEGLDVAARDFLAGMTDRFAVTLFERLFIPKPCIGPISWNQLLLSVCLPPEAGDRGPRHATGSHPLSSAGQPFRPAVRPGRGW